MIIGNDTKKVATDKDHGFIDGHDNDTDRKAESSACSSVLHLRRYGNGEIIDSGRSVGQENERNDITGDGTTQSEGQMVHHATEREFQQLRRRSLSRHLHGRIHHDGNACSLQSAGAQHDIIGREVHAVEDVFGSQEIQEPTRTPLVQFPSHESDTIQRRQGRDESLRIEVGYLSDVGTCNGRMDSRSKDHEDDAEQERNDGHSPRFRLSRGFSSTKSRGKRGTKGDTLTDEEIEQEASTQTTKGKGRPRNRGFTARAHWGRRSLRIATDPTLSPVTPQVRRWKRKRVVSPPPGLIE